MQKKFISNLILILFVNILIKPFWILGIDREVQLIVGEENYGMYYALFNFSFIFSILLDFGITNFNSRLIAQNNHLLKKYLPNLLYIKLFLSFIYFVITFSWALFMGYSHQALFLLLFLCINQFLNSFILFFRSSISALLFFKTDTILSVTDKLLMIIFFIPLYFSSSLQNTFTISYFIYGQTIAYLLTAILAYILVVYHSGWIHISFNYKVFYVLLRKSIPYAFMVLLMSVYNRIDTVLLERIHPNGAAEAGIYAYAYRLLDAVSMIAFLFSGLLLPIFSKLIKEKKSIEQLLNLSFSLLLVPVIIFTLDVVYLSDFIFKFFYSNPKGDPSFLFSILIFSFIGIAASYIVSTLLTANGSIKQLIIISFIGVIINVGLNLIFIPRLGALSCAIVSSITFLMLAIIQSVQVFKLFQLKVNFIKVFKIILILIIQYLLHVLLNSISSSILIHFLLLIIVPISLAILIRVISLKGIWREFKIEMK